MIQKKLLILNKTMDNIELLFRIINDIINNFDKKK